MARVRLDKDFKKAISGLPHAEKDKLLFRLIAKDPQLVDKLHFELLEFGETAELRRDEIQENIDNFFELYRYDGPGHLLSELRAFSGDITRHTKATKDLYGEIYLNFYMLNLAFRKYGDKIRVAFPTRSKTFNKYVVTRCLKLFNLMLKIHEDYHLDFKESMTELGKHIALQPMTMHTAIMLGLDVNYLIKAEIVDPTTFL